MQRVFAGVGVFVAVIVACFVSSRFGYLRGYKTAISHEVAPLIITLDALDQIHAGEVEGATRANEEVCFRLAATVLENDPLDQDLRILVPRLTEYWDTYCVERTHRTAMEKRVGSLLAERRLR